MATFYSISLIKIVKEKCGLEDHIIFFSLLVIDDFWEDMYKNPMRQYVLGPLSIISFVLLIPALIGIIRFIGNLHVK